MLKVALEFVFINSGKTHGLGNEGHKGSSYSPISRNKSHDIDITSQGHAGRDESLEAEAQRKGMGKAFIVLCTAKKGTRQDR